MDCMKMTGVSKAYQNGSEKLYALRDVNLVIEEGTFCLLYTSRCV